MIYQFEISVTQKHIDDARKAIRFKTDECSYCPIALALFEQVSKGIYIVSYNTRYKQHIIRFISFDGKELLGGNPFRVAENIVMGAFTSPELFGTRNHPPVHIKHTKESIAFIIDFDKGLPVKPFSFTFVINSR